MTRLTDLPPAQAKRLAEAECPRFETTPWVTGPALSQRRIAIVSSAGLFVRGEMPFRGRDADYRVIPADTGLRSCWLATFRSISIAPGCKRIGTSPSRSSGSRSSRRRG